MDAPAARSFPEPPPSTAVECLARLVLGLASVALLFGLLAPAASRAGETLAIGWLGLLRLSTFALGLWLAAVVQGARADGHALLLGALLALLCGLAVHAPSPAREGFSPGWMLLQLESQTLAPVLFGLWLARFLKRPGELLAVVLCAAAGDAWFTVFGVPESVSELNPAHALRLAWPAPAGGLALAPTFADLLFGAFYLEAARILGFRRLAVGLAALAGYAVATLLALSSWHALPSLPLVGLGVLVGTWPHFRCTAAEVAKALGLAFLLFALLLGLAALRRQLYPLPKPRPSPPYSRDLALGTRTEERGSNRAWGVDQGLGFRV